MLLFSLLLTTGLFANVWAAQVCCPNIGCFTDAPPFDSIPLPMCIEEMNPVYTMYTRSNQNLGQTFTHTTVPSVFVGSRRTVFLIHGWNSDGTSSWLHSMKNAFLTKEDINVVIVDWGGGAQLANYFQAASNTRTMGAYTALVFNNLINNGGSPARSWCIGHSLGAHHCGHAGMRTATTLHRVTGLDPAGPFFQSSSDLTVGINPTSGALVDIIHTDSDTLGQPQALGHIDFYPSGGLNQPGCLRHVLRQADDELGPAPQGACSHSRAYEFFEESIRRDCFLSRSKCTNYSNLPGSCSSCTCSTNPCAHMGYDLESSCQTAGLFYVDVTSAAPFCVG
jgi:pimeloyl-ACP methyl ester carboxylesterase